MRRLRQDSMDAIGALILFFVISVIADRIEGGRRKKKQRQKEKGLPPKISLPRQRADVPKNIPKNIPQETSGDFSEEMQRKMPQEIPEEIKVKIPVPIPIEIPKVIPKEKPIANLPEKGKIAFGDKFKGFSQGEKIAAGEAAKNAAMEKRKANIHREAILNAITYAEILGAPRAYRYMARKRHRR